MPENTDPTCFFCKQPTDAAHLCHGCGEFVCDDCDPVDAAFGDHDVDDHWTQGVE